MLTRESLLAAVPRAARARVDAHLDAAELLGAVRDPRVARSLGPSGVRGIVLGHGRSGKPNKMPSRHDAHLDFSYPGDFPQMKELYDRAVNRQWKGSELPWETSVDPFNPEQPLLPETFFAFPELEAAGVKLTPKERLDVTHALTGWMMSQFLHGEQGALFAALQVTESVQFFDGKFYGATQVMDEARHVEVMLRYQREKLHRWYDVNDNLFVIIDALLRDGRWDMKFLGMQILVEGLALGAFGTLFKMTREPLLKELLRRVIQDEARHVHYGVLALREHMTTQLSDRERREREDWTLEVVLLMRNRFMAMEVYEEMFEGRITRSKWRELVVASPGMREFRQTMFSRLIPNLRELGLLSKRVLPRYRELGLLEYFGGPAADKLTEEMYLAGA